MERSHVTTSTASLRDIDKANMLGAIAQLPAHLRDGFARASDARTLVERTWPRESHAGSATPRTLVVCGMGGSGVGADLLPAVFDTNAPVVAVKGYDLPAWVSDEDRVVCVSYSGNTAETLRCFEVAMQRSVVAAVITSGGKLGELARERDLPVVEIPGGLQPRAAVGLLFGALAGIAEALNVVDRDVASIIEDAASGAQLIIDSNADLDGGTEPPALMYARDLKDSTIVVCGASESVAVAHRWKAQLNENSKVPAFASSYPELDHNELVGWTRARETGGRWSLIELVPPNVDAALMARMDITRELIGDALQASLRFEPLSATRAGALFELLVLGDYISAYLALASGIDPSPVERIESLKQRLAGR